MTWRLTTTAWLLQRVVISDGWIGVHRASLAALATVSPGGLRVISACWNLTRQGSGMGGFLSLDLADWGKGVVCGMIEMGPKNC